MCAEEGQEAGPGEGTEPGDLGEAAAAQLGVIEDAGPRGAQLRERPARGSPRLFPLAVAIEMELGQLGYRAGVEQADGTVELLETALRIDQAGRGELRGPARVGGRKERRAGQLEKLLQRRGRPRLLLFEEGIDQLRVRGGAAAQALQERDARRQRVELEVRIHRR